MINRNTYARLAQEFIKARGKGFLIASRFIRAKGEAIEKTTDEWGAWLAYFFRLGVKTALMEAKGYYTVPAQWPHEFDKNQTPEEDYEAARHYRERLHRRIAAEAEDRSMPADLGSRIKAYWGDVKRTMPIWEDPKVTRQSLIDESRLVDSYNHGVAEMEAQREMKKQRNAR
jgi:hypothetical protein